MPRAVAQHRFHALDAVRGVAAILVAVLHIPMALSRLVPNSYLAVDLFFLLSGFVVAFAYETRLRASLTVGRFFTMRLIRFYPLYILGVAMSLVTVAQHTLRGHHDPLLHPLALGSAVLFLPNLLARHVAQAVYPFNAPAWSLFFEMLANLVYAALVRLRWARTPLLLSIAASAWAFLVGTHASLNVGVYFDTFWSAIPRVAFSFPLGVVLFRLWTAGRLRVRLWGSRATWATLALLAVTVAVGAVRVASQHTLLLGYAAATVLFPAMVLVGAGCEVPAWLQPVCNALGDLSYPLYAVHFPVYFLLPVASFFLRFTHLGHPRIADLLGLGLLLALLPLAWWLGAHYDLPVRRHLTRRFLSTRSFHA